VKLNLSTKAWRISRLLLLAKKSPSRERPSSCVLKRTSAISDGWSFLKPTASQSFFTALAWSLAKSATKDWRKALLLSPDSPCDPMLRIGPEHRFSSMTFFMAKDLSMTSPPSVLVMHFAIMSKSLKRNRVRSLTESRLTTWRTGVTSKSFLGGSSIGLALLSIEPALFLLKRLSMLAIISTEFNAFDFDRVREGEWTRKGEWDLGMCEGRESTSWKPGD
jgi:hypothetical protein